MNEESKAQATPESDDTSKRLSETEMAHLTVDLQKIEGYDPTAIESSGPKLDSVPSSPATTSRIVKPKSGKKKWILSGVIVACALVVLGGGWAAYALWFQNPEKVVNDSLYNIMTAKTITANGDAIFSPSDGSKLSVSFDMKAGYKEGFGASVKPAYTYKNGAKIPLSADLLRTSNGDFYFKINQLKDGYKTYLNELTKQAEKEGYSQSESAQQTKLLDQLIKPIIDKLDAQWFNFKLSDLSSYDKGSADEYECTNKTITNLANSQAQLAELGKLYQKYKVIVIDENLGIKDGNLGFVTHIDSAEFKKLSNELKNTQLYKDLEACSKKKENDTSEPGVPTTDKYDTSIDTSSTRIELWIDQWTHALNTISTTTTNGVADKRWSLTTRTNLQYNQPVSLIVPKDSTSAKDIVTSFSGVFAGGENEANIENSYRVADLAQVSIELTKYGTANKGVIPGSAASLCSFVKINLKGADCKTLNGNSRDPSGEKYRVSYRYTPKNIGEIGYWDKSACDDKSTSGVVAAATNNYALLVFQQDKSPYCLDNKS